MKKSIVIAGASALVLAGIGAYLYFKGKKATTPNDITITPNDSTTTANDSTSTPNNTTESTNSTTKEIYSNRTGRSTSVVNTSLGLNPTTNTQTPSLTTDKIVALYNETQTENYKKAKLLSNEIQKDYARINQYKRTKTKDAVRSDIANKTKQVNALGYKVLPNGDIEKM
jgi:hypothetical protein